MPSLPIYFKKVVVTVNSLDRGKNHGGVCKMLVKHKCSVGG